MSFVRFPPLVDIGRRHSSGMHLAPRLAETCLARKGCSDCLPTSPGRTPARSACMLPPLSLKIVRLGSPRMTWFDSGRRDQRWISLPGKRCTRPGRKLAGSDQQGSLCNSLAPARSETARPRNLRTSFVLAQAQAQVQTRRHVDDRICRVYNLRSAIPFRTTAPERMRCTPWSSWPLSGCCRARLGS